MLSFFQKNKSKKNQQTQSTNTLPTSAADIKSSTGTLAEVKQSLTSALSGRLKHKGSVRSVNLEFSEFQSAGAGQSQQKNQQQPETKLHMLKKKSTESFLAKLGTDEQRKKKPEVINEVDSSSHMSSQHDTLNKPKTSRFMHKSHIPFITSGYFTVGRNKKPAPSIGE
jgi:hypothetical protein